MWFPHKTLLVAGVLALAWHGNAAPAADSPAKLIVVPGKGHQVCDEFFHCQEFVDFVAKHALVARRP